MHVPYSPLTQPRVLLPPPPPRYKLWLSFHQVTTSQPLLSSPNGLAVFAVFRKKRREEKKKNTYSSHIQWRQYQSTSYLFPSICNPWTHGACVCGRGSRATHLSVCARTISGCFLLSLHTFVFPLSPSLKTVLKHGSKHLNLKACRSRVLTTAAGFRELLYSRGRQWMVGQRVQWENSHARLLRFFFFPFYVVDSWGSENTSLETFGKLLT